MNSHDESDKLIKWIDSEFDKSQTISNFPHISFPLLKSDGVKLGQNHSTCVLVLRRKIFGEMSKHYITFLCIDNDWMGK